MAHVELGHARLNRAQDQAQQVVEAPERSQSTAVSGARWQAMPHSVTVTPSPPLQATLQAATRRLAPVYRLARGLFPSSRVREEPFRVLGPILLEVHHEYSRIEGARLGDLFISRQGLRANFPRSVSISWIQSVSISNRPRCTKASRTRS